MAPGFGSRRGSGSVVVARSEARATFARRIWRQRLECAAEKYLCGSPEEEDETSDFTGVKWTKMEGQNGTSRLGAILK